MKKEVKLSVEIPMTPNFIRLTPGGVVPIKFFTDKELRMIGREWTKELIKKAQRMRK